MKKIIIISLLLIAFSMFADLEDAAIIVSSGNVNAGESISIDIATSELIEDYDVISFQFEMNYDPNTITYNDFDEGDIFTDGMLLVNETEPGNLIAAYSHYEAQTGTGVIIRLTFTGISGNSDLDIHDFKFNATPINNTTDGSITVNGQNLLPLADAGADIAVDEETAANLDGSNSYDPEGNNLTYLWTAPAEIILSDPTSATPSFTAPTVTEDTEYIISLIVNDGIHNSLPDEIVVTVINVNALDNVPTHITEVGIHSISPNPFNPSTTINFLVPCDETSVEVNVYSVKGQLVKGFHLSGLVPNSLSRVTWQGTDERGNAVASGVYFCQIKGASSKAYSRMLLLK
ncbi:MAG: T9SS type A sorting domain-containing protein [Candidatus Cloacimonetes bacterium]|nr:T9SS type A sorting domain-containing protein [Candidatus Cloacimonadota bacterium]